MSGDWGRSTTAPAVLPPSTLLKKARSILRRRSPRAPKAARVANDRQRRHVRTSGQRLAVAGLDILLFPPAKLRPAARVVVRRNFATAETLAKRPRDRVCGGRRRDQSRRRQHRSAGARGQRRRAGQPRDRVSRGWASGGRAAGETGPGHVGGAIERSRQGTTAPAFPRRSCRSNGRTPRPPATPSAAANSFPPTRWAAPSVTRSCPTRPVAADPRWPTRGAASRFRNSSSRSCSPASKSRRSSPPLRSSPTKASRSPGWSSTKTTRGSRCCCRPPRASTFPKQSIEARKLQATSPMPHGLVKTPAELGDILAYLLSDNPRSP